MDQQRQSRDWDESLHFTGGQRYKQIQIWKTITCVSKITPLLHRPPCSLTSIVSLYHLVIHRIDRQH